MFQFVYLNHFQSDQNVLIIIMYHIPHDYFAIQIIKSFIIISGHKEVYICDTVNCLCLVFCLLVTNNTFHHYYNLLKLWFPCVWWKCVWLLFIQKYANRRHSPVITQEHFYQNYDSALDCLGNSFQGQPALILFIFYETSCTFWSESMFIEAVWQICYVIQFTVVSKESKGTVKKKILSIF